MPPIVVTPELIGEAIVRAAMVTGELSLLSYRDEQAIKGHVAFRARWVAFAALLALHPTLDLDQLAKPLGLGSSPMRSLSSTRGQGWWDEACVHRLFLDLAGAADRRDLAKLAGLHKIVTAIVAGLMTPQTEGGVA